MSDTAVCEHGRVEAVGDDPDSWGGRLWRFRCLDCGWQGETVRHPLDVETRHERVQSEDA